MHFVLRHVVGSITDKRKYPIQVRRSTVCGHGSVSSTGTSNTKVRVLHTPIQILYRFPEYVENWKRTETTLLHISLIPPRSIKVTDDIENDVVFDEMLIVLDEFDVVIDVDGLFLGESAERSGI